LPDHRIQEIIEDQNCFLWIKTTGESVGCYDLKKDCFVDFTGSGEYLRHYSNVYFVNKNEAWVTGEREGCRLIRYRKDRTFTSIAFDVRSGLASNLIRDLKVGAEGWAWIATGKGLYYWDGKKLHAVDERMDFMRIAVHGKKTYFLTNKGAVYTFLNGALKKEVSIEGDFTYYDNLILGKKWLIFSGTNTWSFDFETHVLTLAEEALQIKRAKVIKDNKGESWVYGNSGVLTWIDSQSGKVTPFLLMPEEKRNYVDRERYYVVHDSRGIIWIGTYGNGLFVYDVREFLKEELGVYFEVVAEADGDAGLERARNYDADLIISDVVMPGCSGFELTRKLKTDFNTSHIPVILLTAMTSVDNHVKGVECGADAYITKPFSPRLLLTRAFKLIEQREKLKEKFSHDPNQVRPALCSSDKDKFFVEKMGRIMETQLGNSQFTVDEFASMMGVGRSIFYRKVRGVTGYSPNEYIRIMRMKKAAELLSSPENLTVAEVSYQVGINDPFYFSKCFKLQFGVTPSVYQKGGRGEKEKEANADSEVKEE
jgi:CheY-like chemotaxis protein